jgi:nitrogen regulatory protein PII 1
MKMVRAIIRPQKTEDVVDALEADGYVALTKMDVAGRGKQKGLLVGSVYYDELPKTMLMLVTEDEKVEEIIEIISKAAYTGNPGDGKIFISEVEKAYTIRTGVEGV